MLRVPLRGHLSMRVLRETGHRPQADVRPYKWKPRRLFR